MSYWHLLSCSNALACGHVCPPLLLAEVYISYVCAGQPSVTAWAVLARSWSKRGNVEEVHALMLEMQDRNLLIPPAVHASLALAYQVRGDVGGIVRRAHTRPVLCVTFGFPFGGDYIGRGRAMLVLPPASLAHLQSGSMVFGCHRWLRRQPGTI